MSRIYEPLTDREVQRIEAFYRNDPGANRDVALTDLRLIATLRAAQADNERYRVVAEATMTLEERVKRNRWLRRQHGCLEAEDREALREARRAYRAALAALDGAPVT